MNSKYSYNYSGDKKVGTIDCISKVDLSLALQNMLKKELIETGSFIDGRSLIVDIKSNVKFKCLTEEAVQDLRKKVEELTKDIENILYNNI